MLKLQYEMGQHRFTTLTGKRSMFHRRKYLLIQMHHKIDMTPMRICVHTIRHSIQQYQGGCTPLHTGTITSAWLPINWTGKRAKGTRRQITQADHASKEWGTEPKQSPPHVKKKYQIRSNQLCTTKEIFKPQRVLQPGKVKGVHHPGSQLYPLGL